MKPGFGTPSHARVLVSERWESRHAKLRRVLLRVKWQTEGGMDDDDEEESKQQWEAGLSTKHDLIPEYYDGIMNTGQGRALRKEMLQQALAIVQVGGQRGR
jgi:hypothetical protein